MELCDFCHAATKGGHFLLVNPFADPKLAAEVKATTLPMYKGQFTCVSCHNPHGGTGEEKFLRKEFIALALKSRRVRPHFMKSFCEACHTVRPTLPKGTAGAQKLAEIPLREGGDPNKLCNRCHESGLSKENAHPLRAVNETFKKKIPAGWPLSADGGLTCLTCHTAGDAATYDAKNANFLRGAPYETRNSMCWPYAFGTIGFSYFSTSSHASFDDDDWDAEDGDAISVEQIGEMVLAFRAGGGVLIPVRGGRSPILLDLGAFYTWNDVTTYATPDRVVDVGGAVVILPIRGATNSVTFRLGVAWAF